MVDLISTIQQESDATFSLRLMNANADTREELLSMRDGMKNREAFIQSKQGKAVFFDTVAERLQKLEEWYPRAYGILKQMLPCLMMWPDDMAPTVLKLADSWIEGCILPDDRKILCLSVGV